MSHAELSACRDALLKRYNSFCGKGEELLLTRGKPCSQQLDLSLEMMDILNSDSEMVSEKGEDCRNYGNADGLVEMRRLFAELMDVPADCVIIGNNSSLGLMFDVVSCGVTHGFGGCAPWGKQEKVRFLCPSPGYDRHFSVTEYFGIEMIPVPMTPEGPDMNMVENYVNNDPTVKGIWCVPKHSNPQGITYSDETVRRFASLKPAAKDFRIFWDNAYCVHDWTDTPPVLLSLYAECEKRGTLDLPILFASTSKITFAGAGISAVAAWNGNLRDIRKHFSIRTIGPNKLDQLSHIRFLKNKEGVLSIMKRHREILAPKFRVTDEVLEKELAGTGAATWTKPTGGYFVSVDVMEGCSARVVELCKKAGVILNPAGSTFPYRRDPKDTNIRLAPSYPPVDELARAMEIFCVCVKLAAAEKLLAA